MEERSKNIYEDACEHEEKAMRDNSCVKRQLSI